jgi:LPXTG-motif cell wall-anchored protein
VPAASASGLLPVAVVGLAGLGGAAVVGRRRRSKSTTDR